MYTDLLNTLTEQNQKFFGPAIKFNQLVAKNIEQLASIQIDAVQNISNASVSQLKAATEVQDVKSAIDFNLSQVSAMTQLSQQMIEDGQKLTKLGQEFKDNLEALTKEQMQTAQA
ncbi:phasin family protein [Pseudoalteromonas sp. SS15]|jgi:phasin family protein|uniref:Phasin family protein n=1 Tax=Pseudoalteromonas phenolica TaxID=161398 RepID=A0A5S3YUI5_9GAMM|nr:phasin family protein [Pseudoalteromonas phenolica]TMP81374.1 phasin family protein [Pseudoalteromonas phenolica]|tara:strand:+ start:1332 stop:1676 length:345 start_codon:yes stop_codon:yes gene_type:complete